MIFGHQLTAAALMRELPPVVLLRGPKSVGKRTLAEEVVNAHGVHPTDARFYEQMTTDEAREVKTFLMRAPFGPFKSVTARLDHVDERALNALLKLLEEPPRTARFLLLCENKPLDTIMSRSHNYRLGLLNETELHDVLTKHLGMAEHLAGPASRAGRGQVCNALMVNEQQNSRAYVLGVLKAVSDKDTDLLDLAVAKWDDQCQDLLIEWATEARTGRWSVFTEQETFGLSKGQVPMQILRGMKLRARPRLTARVVLGAIIQA